MPCDQTDMMRLLLHHAKVADALLRCRASDHITSGYSRLARALSRNMLRCTRSAAGLCSASEPQRGSIIYIYIYMYVSMYVYICVCIHITINN